MLIFWHRAHPIRRTEIAKQRRMTAPARDTIEPILRADRIFLRLRFISTIPIVAPFLYIAVHIVDAPGIRWGLPDVQRHHFFNTAAPIGIGIPALPDVFMEGIGKRIAGRKVRRCAGATGVFPFRLCRKPVRFPFAFG